MLHGIKKEFVFRINKGSAKNLMSMSTHDHNKIISRKFVLNSSMHVESRFNKTTDIL